MELDSLFLAGGGVVFISEESSLIFPETQTGRDETLPCSLLPPFLTHWEVREILSISPAFLSVSHSTS